MHELIGCKRQLLRVLLGNECESRFQTGVRHRGPARPVSCRQSLPGHLVFARQPVDDLGGRAWGSWGHARSVANAAASNETASEMTESIRLPDLEAGEAAETTQLAAAEHPARLGEAGETAPDDRDLIVVEGPAEEQPVATVRRQEYRQLFARLRRGGDACRCRG